MIWGGIFLDKSILMVGPTSGLSQKGKKSLLFSATLAHGSPAKKGPSPWVQIGLNPKVRRATRPIAATRRWFYSIKYL